MIHNILIVQQKAVDKEKTKLVLISNIITYLLEPTKTNYIAVFTPLGQLLKTYSINVTLNDLRLLKQTKSNNDILYNLADIIKNHTGYNNNLLFLLKNLITHYGK